MSNAITVASIGTGKPEVPQKLVTIKAGYAKDYSGPKYLEEGKIYEVSEETGAEIVKKGAGKIYKGEIPDEQAEAEAAAAKAKAEQEAAESKSKADADAKAKAEAEAAAAKAKK